MYHLLLLEPKITDARLLIAQIEANHKYKVTHVTDLRQAQSRLGEQPFQLALVPISRDYDIVHLLRVAQQDLPVVVLADSDDHLISERQASAAWGVITKSVLLDALAELDVVHNAALDFESLFWESSHSRPPVRLDISRLTLIAQRILEKQDLRFLLFCKGTQRIGFQDELDESQLMEVAEHVQASWDARPRTAQMQRYTRTIPAEVDNGFEKQESLLLFTRPFYGYLLTVGADPDSSLTELRHTTDLIVSQVQRKHAFRKEIEPNLDMNDTPLLESLQLTQLWFVCAPLSAAQTTKVGQILLQLCESRDWDIRHIDVEERHVHFVIHGETTLTSSELTQQLMRESTDLFFRGTDLEQSARLWHDAHYVREMDRPFNQEELDLLCQLNLTVMPLPA